MAKVVVIGAGQAGLATSWQLKRLGVDHVVLNAHANVGDNWRKRWKGLRLFSPVRYNHLPGLPFPGGEWELPDKDATADYLASYAQKFQLPVEGSTQVTRLRPKPGGGFTLETNQGERQAQAVVVATGAYGTPFRPEIPGLPADLPQFHTSEIQDPADIPGQKVLVVGAGASGVQLARLLAQLGREVLLSGRELPNLPRRFMGKDIYWWLYKTKAMTWSLDSWVGRQMYERSAKTGGDVTVGEDLKGLTKLGVKRVGKLKEWTEKGPQFGEGSSDLVFDSLVWATGYRNNFDWIEAEVSAGPGLVKHERGLSTTVPGLCFMGIHFQYRTNSSLLGGVGPDAAYIAEQLQSYLSGN